MVSAGVDSKGISERESKLKDEKNIGGGA